MATINVQNNQLFGGPLVVHQNAQFQGRVFPAGHSSFGTNTGPVSLRGGFIYPYRASGGSTMVTLQKGTLTFEGSSGIFVDNQNDASCVTRFDVADLVRTNRGILTITAADGGYFSPRLGTQCQFRVTAGGPGVTNDIVPRTS